MRLFGSDRIARIMERMGLEEGEVIQHPMITRSVERAQKKVEENNYGIRKRFAGIRRCDEPAARSYLFAQTACPFGRTNQRRHIRHAARIVDRSDTEILCRRKSR